ncbi:MAG TPA: penicillin-binding protein 2 [Actinomycetes bacterium]|nr:penicillin-binding protein 2 [Actinomycetes bacterium]
MLPHHSPLRPRLTLLSLIALVLFGALLSRLWFLQVLAAERYGDLADVNRVRQVVVEAPRGRILDRQGRVLVRNRASWAITVKLSELADRDEREAVLDRLARLLGVKRGKIDERLRDYTGSPLRGVPVAEDVPADTLFYLAEHGDQFPGVAPEVVALREYPYGKLAAHVLGYVGEVSPDELKSSRFRGLQQGDQVGKAGVELTYDRFLRGRDGVQDLEVNAAGRVIRSLGGRQPVPGMDLRLSIDVDLQKQAEKSLADGMRLARTLPDSQRGGNYPAPAATAVVLDPNDGSLLALASLPEYDPRKFVGGISRRDFAAYSSDPDNPLINRAIQSAYPPGSTWKPVTALAGLEHDLITPSTVFHCPGSYRFGNSVKHDWTPIGHGTVNLTQSLRQSCDVYYYNVGAIFARLELSQKARGRNVSELMQATARSLGFGSAPGLDLPYATGGTVPTRAWRKQFWETHRSLYCKGSSQLYRELCRDGWQWQGGDDLNIAIGQGALQVSPLQLALGYGAVANGGTVYSAHVAEAVVDPGSGKTVRAIHPKVAQVARIPAGAFAAVTQGLATVPAAGTAAGAFAGFPLDRFPIAGKTGTADLPPKAPFAWFASFAPVQDPRYVIVTMVEQGGHGGESAAPVARALYEKLFGLPIRPVLAGNDRSG